MSPLPAPTDDDLERIVRYVVGAVSPTRVVLFGSAARGQQRVDGDLDLLVVVADDANVGRVECSLYAGMWDVDVHVPVDFVVVTESDLERHRENVGLIYRRALREGRQLYAA